MHVVAPTVSLKEPGGHDWHDVAPATLLKVPAAHGTQGCWPVALNVPGGQS